MLAAAAGLVVALMALIAGPVAAQGLPAAPVPARDSLATLVARGDSAWGRDEHRAAFVAYDAVVRTDSAFSTRALFRVGLLHAWANRFPAAIAAQRLYVRLEPVDLEGRVALGRTLAWANRFAEAVAQYDTVLTRDASYREAVIGKAQALAWSDDIPAGEAVLVTWLDARPGDVGAWVALGQFRRWRGDISGAAAAIDRALALAPGDADARQQRAWLRVDVAPSVAWTLVGAKDSEANTLWHREITGQIAWRGAARIGAALRLREASVTDGDAAVMPGATLFVHGPLGTGGLTARAEGGVVQFPQGVAAATTALRGGLRVAAAPLRGLRVSGGASREPFDEVLSTAARRMMFSVVDADATLALHPRWQLGLGASVGAVDGAGAVEKTRRTFLAAVRYAPRRGTQLSLSHREASWDAPAFGVFFAPQRWATTELSLSSERSADLGLVLAGDLGLASQLVGFQASPLDHAIVPRATLRLGVRAAPGREVTLGLTYANVAGAGAITASDYRYGAATLGGRWTF